MSEYKLGQKTTHKNKPTSMQADIIVGVQQVRTENNTKNRHQRRQTSARLLGKKTAHKTGRHQCQRTAKWGRKTTHKIGRY